MRTNSECTSKYLAIDLDGTLVRTDLFLESLLKLLKKKPYMIFQVLLWMLHGRAFTKDRVASLVDIDVESIPYEKELIEYIKEEKAKDKIIILATASSHIYANKIAEYLELFDHVIASDEKNNLKGRNKLTSIESIVADDGFVYAGNSTDDRPIWKGACSCIFVNAPHGDINRSNMEGKTKKIFLTSDNVYKSFIKEMRPVQWAKNSLVFVPLITSHRYDASVDIYLTIVAFLCFCLCASGVYFLNDLMDLDADRKHPIKQYRPLASGDISILSGIYGSTVLPAISLTISLILLPLSFSFILVLYYAMTMIYSLYLKSISTADVMVLSILYTLRVIAGSFAIDVNLSSWLMAFSIFVFVSLAYLKRYIETSASDNNKKNVHGRGYSYTDCEALFSLGVSNITASVLVLALYINSAEVIATYKSPALLWFLCLLMLYWGNRIWIGARRGKITEDPVVFAIKDKISQFSGVAFLTILLAAKFIKI